ncbi:MAG: TonB C-terminal domain-containing protein [Myxococcota bacterium]
MLLLALLSLFVHVPLYGAFRWMSDGVEPFPRPNRDGQWMMIHTFPTKPAPPKAPPIPEDAQFVETPAQEHLVDAKPVETKYLSDKTTRTEKETRSAVTAPATPKRGSATQPQHVQKPSPVQSPLAKSEQPTTSPQKSDKVELASGGMNLPTTKSGDKPHSVMAKSGAGGTGTGLLVPSTSEAAAQANLQALDAGDLTSNDHLPSLDRGRQTVLNANQYRYADFFLRVKQQVEKHWRPSEAYLRRDPTGQAYGVKDRYTVLRVELDKSGRIASLTTTRQSGLDFMDEEAKRAFREAHPFLNPPAELVDDDGKIRFEFGFYFEITGGKYRFQWRRL